MLVRCPPSCEAAGPGTSEPRLPPAHGSNCPPGADLRAFGTDQRTPPGAHPPARGNSQRDKRIRACRLSDWYIGEFGRSGASNLVGEAQSVIA